MKKSENDSFSIVPVKIPKQLNDLYYNGFCNDMLWPLFHYFPTYSVFNESYFHAYHEANSIFCSEIVKITKPGDFIWIHDYQLFLLPAMIRKKAPDVTLGFFLHIPFPSFEIFRLMPRLWRETIINGMLGADLIGFHTHDYNQNFIKTVKRTTGYECRQNIIYTTDRIVKSDAFPIGIDYEKFNSACLKDAVLKEKKKIKSGLAGQKLIFSVDRLDYSKGLLPKLKGYETFLEKYPKWHSKVVFNMVVVPSRDIIEKYKDIKKEIESFIGRINGKFSTLSWRPIIYQYKSLSFNELVALYDMSDIGLITPLRDGMNLVAKEYIACQTENKGVLILSEMAGAAAELNEAILINPADNNEIASSIDAALKMKPVEKNARLVRMQGRIKNYNVFAWADDFFHQTNDITDQQKKMSVKFINSKIVTQIIANYGKARKRILFLDYDGTLVSFSRYPEQANIDKKTLQIVRNLTEDPKNKIVIISGRGKDFLERQFIGLKVTLVAEHGLFLKEINKSWKATIKTDQRWKESVVPILMEYVNRCNGTFIEEKTGSIAWHYRNADSDFAQFRLNELRDDLSEIIRHKTDFEILEGNKVLEVKSGKYDKGEMAKSIMKNKNYDFVLAAGDDKTDESIYRALDEKAYTIRVGLNPSEARFNITDYSLLLRLLQDLKN
jgi:trehalose 6-phosphate synthase/phosphatase